MSSLDTTREAFRALHASGCFVMPNPWSVGTARYLQSMGFKALATSSAGFAFSRGLADGALQRDEALAHIREIATAADVPVNADFEAGYADSPEGVAANVKLCVEAGAAGLSIEDATGDAAKPLFEIEEATERMQAARRAIDESQSGVLLTGRAECYLVGHSEPFRESVRRLEAYAAAGADVLYAPGVTKREEMMTIVRAVAPKPVNILMGTDTGIRVSDLAAMGVRRISVGSSLARAAWGGFVRAARQISDDGRFAGFDDAAPYQDLNAFFRADVQKRST